jgi:hypothetical protein
MNHCVEDGHIALKLFCRKLTELILLKNNVIKHSLQSFVLIPVSEHT